VRDNTLDRSHLMAFYNESAFDPNGEREECLEMFDIDDEQGSSNSEQQAHGDRSSTLKRVHRLTMHNSFDLGFHSMFLTRTARRKSLYQQRLFHQEPIVHSSNNISEEPESHRISKASSTALNQQVIQAQRLDESVN
jgi:hypothetical protein